VKEVNGRNIGVCAEDFIDSNWIVLFARLPRITRKNPVSTRMLIYLLPDVQI